MKPKDAKEIAKEEERYRRIISTYKLKILHAGDAVNFPKEKDSCSIHYIGKLEDGTVFDNTYNRGQPVYFVLGAKQVIKAIEEALPILSRGEKARLVVPPECGYGERGYPPIIPPNAVTIYDIELVSFSTIGEAERLHREARKKKEEEDKARAKGTVQYK